MFCHLEGSKRARRACEQVELKDSCKNCIKTSVEEAGAYLDGAQLEVRVASPASGLGFLPVCELRLVLVAKAEQLSTQLQDPQVRTTELD